MHLNWELISFKISRHDVKGSYSDFRTIARSKTTVIFLTCGFRFFFFWDIMFALKRMITLYSTIIFREKFEIFASFFPNNTYIIGHYNPSARITNYLIKPLALCALILYMSVGTYSLKSTDFWVAFHDRKSAEMKSAKNIFIFSFWCLTYYLLDYGDFNN